jgi:hypothetical protein
LTPPVNLSPDVELRDNFSKVLNCMGHFKVVNHNLVITLDYDSGGFAEWQYLDLIGDKFKEQLKGKTIAEYCREKYTAHYVEDLEK